MDQNEVTADDLNPAFFAAPPCGDTDEADDDRALAAWEASRES